jgi:Domain of unknown function (DUF4129)
MAIDAIALRPRKALGLFDAALNLCAQAVDVFLLTLPAGALLVYAVFLTREAVLTQRSVLFPVFLLAASVCVRSIGLAAASHYAHALLMDAQPPNLLASLTQSFRRWPTLVFATVYCLSLNSLILLFTGGIAWLFVNAQVVAYAVIVRGTLAGRPLSLYHVCAEQLGAAKASAVGLRLFGLSALLVFVNLHLATVLLLTLGTKILGADLTFVSRFCSLDNDTWILLLGGVTFVLFEPLRACAATLLLIDGRVREEGFDLLAAVEQLPKRRKPSVSLSVAGALCLLSTASFANSELVNRTIEVADQCNLIVTKADRELLGKTATQTPNSLSRFVSTLESSAYDEEDCDTAETLLLEGMQWMRQVQDSSRSAPPADARLQAKRILEGPEFSEDAAGQDDPPPKDDSDEDSWFKRLLKWIIEWLQNAKSTDRDEKSNLKVPSSASMPGASTVMLVAAVATLAALALVSWRLLKTPKQSSESATLSFAENTAAIAQSSALDNTPQGWAGLADTYATQGQFRDAIRHLYLALLSHFHHAGVIHYDPHLSNWEYLLAFRGPSEFKRRFRELTHRFDFAWYGDETVTRDAWNAFRKLAEPIFVSAEGAGKVAGV